MIQNIVAHPAFFLFLIIVLGLLMTSAVVRVRRERRLKYRGILEQRKARQACKKGLRRGRD